MTDSIPSKAVEEFVVAVRKASKQRVDWHWAGGRAIIKYVGKRDKVIAALKAFRHLHDDAYEKMMRESNSKIQVTDTNGNTVPMYDDEQIHQTIKGRWDYAESLWGEPETDWSKVKIVMPTYKDIEPKYQQWFKDTIFFAEATPQEYHAIWQEYRFEQVNPSFLIEIGKVGKNSVVVEFRFVRLNGQLVCLYHGTSRVVDMTMIQEWLEKTFKPRWDKGTRFAHCDSLNFHHAIDAVREKTGRPVPIHHYCSHPDCYNKQHHETRV